LTPKRSVTRGAPKPNKWLLSRPAVPLPTYSSQNILTLPKAYFLSPSRYCGEPGSADSARSLSLPRGVGASKPAVATLRSEHSASVRSCTCSAARWRMDPWRLARFKSRAMRFSGCSLGRRDLRLLADTDCPAPGGSFEPASRSRGAASSCAVPCDVESMALGEGGVTCPPPLAPAAGVPAASAACAGLTATCMCRPGPLTPGSISSASPGLGMCRGASAGLATSAS